MLPCFARELRARLRRGERSTEKSARRVVVVRSEGTVGLAAGDGNAERVGERASLAGQAGFEPATVCLSGKCSIH